MPEEGYEYFRPSHWIDVLVEAMMEISNAWVEHDNANS
jgi:hypothetical protein